MNDLLPTDRKPWAAAVLSLFCTGLGHIYCGKIVKGLVLFAASLLFAPLAVLAAWWPPSSGVLLGLIAMTLGVVGLYVYAVIDAFLAARRLQRGYVLKEYNRPLVYVPLMLLGVLYPGGTVQYVRSHAMEAFYIPTASMAPSILTGDRILANKLHSGRAPLHRGEVVVYRSPVNRRQNWLKRVIALPGDTVAIHDDQVVVNGKPLPRDRVPASSLAAIAGHLSGDVYYETNAGRRYMVMLGGGDTQPDYAETTVPEGTCFVLGDNRNRSRDSRRDGFVPLGDILGEVAYIHYPAATWERFGTYHD